MTTPITATTTLVVGGTGHLGRTIAGHFAERGDDVIVTGREQVTADEVASGIGFATRGLALDLSRPREIADAVSSVDRVDHVVITAADTHPNSLESFDVDLAVKAITIKLVGYAEVVRSLRDRLGRDGSVVLFGGLAKERPYPGSTMVSTFNAGISGLTKTLAREIAPHRVNSLHPGLVGDSRRWRDTPVEKQPFSASTPIGRLISRHEIVDAVDFLLRNGGVNGIDLHLDGGLLVT